MNKQLQSSIDPSKNQVFLLSWPCSIPFIFARHAYFVANNKWNIERWDVLAFKRKANTLWWHLHQNALDIDEGINIFPFFWPRWTPKIIGRVQWDIARSMIKKIQNSPENYPCKHSYSLLWPNSNSYVAWIIYTFPDCWLRLPRSCIGRKYFCESVIWKYFER
jgi:hypothetical protein